MQSEQADERGMAFTAGLLSILNSLFDQPLAEEILTDLPLSKQIQKVQLKHQGPVGRALKCTLAGGNSEWDKISAPGYNWEQILNTYLDSTQLAFQEQNSLLI